LFFADPRHMQKNGVNVQDRIRKGPKDDRVIVNEIREQLMRRH
jgi:hypothetical protein